MKTRTPRRPRGPARALLAASAATVLLVACNKAPDGGPQPPLAPPATTLGTQLDDTVITAAVKSALLGEPEVKSLDLQVETRKGTVQLSGTVDNPAQIDRAAALAAAAEGSRSVRNELKLKR